MPQPVRVVFLGGLGEIGRNCAAIEVDGRIMFIDCGLMFPDNDMAGIDLVLPDFSWLRDNSHRVEGVVATHGHEDHIGAIGFLLDEMKLKVIGSPLTVGLAKNRIEERGHLKKAEFIEVRDGERIKVGPFDMEFFPVTHSVPHGYATAFHTPQGVILHSGDFKLDMTPVDGRLSDLAGIGHLATDDGIRLFLCDSTNAQEAGFSASETSIGQNLQDILRARPGRRIVVACFASHIHRVQQIANAAIECDRTVVTMGRSMNKNVALARQMGLLDIPDDRIAKIEDVDRYDDGQVCIISTGSQGEPMSALARMSSGDNKFLQIKEHDCVILSSHPIPGNETSVATVIEGLIRRGAEVIDSHTHRVHATGHAQSEELKVLHSIVRPEWFIPVHGEYRHMVEHARLADPGRHPRRTGSGVLRWRLGDAERQRRHAGRRCARQSMSTSTAHSVTWAKGCSTNGAPSAPVVSSRPSCHCESRDANASLVGSPQIVSRGGSRVPKATRYTKKR